MSVALMKHSHAADAGPVDVAARGEIRRNRLARLFSGLATDATRFDFYYTMRHIDANMESDFPLGRAPRPRFEPLRLKIGRAHV